MDNKNQPYSLIVSAIEETYQIAAELMEKYKGKEQNAYEFE